MLEELFEEVDEDEGSKNEVKFLDGRYVNKYTSTLPRQGRGCNLENKFILKTFSSLRHQKTHLRSRRIVYCRLLSP